MKPALVTFAFVDLLGAAAQAATAVDPLLSMLGQIPFVVAIIWLFLKLADKQEATLKNLQQQHTEAIQAISARFEEIDRRRSSDNAALISTLLAIIAEDNINPDQAGRLARGLRERQRQPSTRTQELLLKKLEE